MVLFSTNKTKSASMHHADHVLRCAVSFKQSNSVSDENTELPTSFGSSNEAIVALKQVLLLEARIAMQSKIVRPENAYLHPVDLESQPGVVISQTNLKIRRAQTPIATTPVDYSQQIWPERDDVKFTVPCAAPSKEAAQSTAIKQARSYMKRVQNKAAVDLKADDKTTEAIAKRNELKRLRSEETKEQRQERIQNKKKQSVEKPTIAKKKPTPDEKETTIATSPETPRTEIADQCVKLQTLLDEDECDQTTAPVLLPSRRKVRNSTTAFFNSPIPFDRHLRALQYCAPNKSIEMALLHAKPSPDLILIRGPPGTGKTSTLLSYVTPEKRVLICSSTNVGTANIYQRAVSMDIDCSLLISPLRIPTGIAITSQNPHARVVCCTVSGRTGPALVNEEFDLVLLDEGGQCMEACTWGLLRSQVQRIVIVGDINQLPALVSDTGKTLLHDRSLMKRLLDQGYPSQLLKTQRRMHPEIFKYPNRAFYNNLLLTEYTPVVVEEEGDMSPYKVLRTTSEPRACGSSFDNDEEADVCVAEALKAKRMYESVVILVPYQAQCRRVLAHKSDIEVFTIDSYQGREADAVILSIVRTRELGFWADERRLTVALTRARHYLRIIGASDKWTGKLQELREDAEVRQLVASCETT